MSSGTFPSPRRRMRWEIEQQKREAKQRDGDEETKRRLGELVNSMLEEEAARKDAEGRAEYRNTYRPDETDLFGDLTDERYFEESEREYHRER